MTKKYHDWLLSGKPRLVQLEANWRSYGKTGYAYFMEMRLGKTAALLNEYLLYRREEKVKKLLIIAPSQYKYGWRIEARKFGISEPIHVFESSAKADATKFRGDIMIANYEAMQHEGPVRVLSKFNADMVVADESVNIKNRTTLQFKRTYELARNAKIIRVLTGKPVVLGPHDLWSQLRFIRQLDGFNFFAFKNMFCKMGGFMGKQVKGMQNGEYLAKLLAPCSFAARRVEWGTNFESDYELREPKILPEQQVHYDEMEEDFITILKSGVPITADQVMTKHVKLQQISSGFVIDAEKKVHQIVPMDKIPKLVDLKYSLENEIIDKVLVICHYIHSIETLLLALAEYRPALIAGNILMQKLGKNVEHEKRFFNEDPRCRVLIAQVQAVKYGHMLMGTKENPCLDIVFYENSYNLDARIQSEQRPQGEGQIRGLHITDYGSTKVEKAIIRALQRKEDVSQAIMRTYD